MKDSPGKFYKASVEKKPYFNKDTIFLITNGEKIDGKKFYWVKNMYICTSLCSKIKR